MTSQLSEPRRTRHPLLVLVALLASIALVLSACGGDDDDASPDTTEGDSTSPESTAPQEDDTERDPEGVVQMGYDLVGTASGGFFLDPAEINVSITNSSLLRHIYGSFLRPTVDGELVPDLAEATDVPDDGTIVLTLREGATFSDGSPFDAEAVKAGLERQLNEGDPAGLLDAFFNLESVEATDPQTVTLTIANGAAQAWHDTYLPGWETTIVKPDSDFSMPVGAGPFEVTAYTPEESMTLERRDDYWDAESILVGGIEMTQVAESQAAVSAISADQIDMARIEPAQADGLSGDDSFLFTPDPAALVNFQICKDQAPLDNVDARRALQLSVDSEAISDALFGGTYEPAKGIWPADHPFHDPANEEAVAFDLEAAQQALVDSGNPDGFEFDAYVIQSGGVPEIAEVLQQQWASIGITANLIPADNYVEDFLGAGASGIGMIPVMGSPKTGQWSGTSIGNACQYADPEMDELAAQVGTASGDELAQVWMDIEALVVDQVLSGLLMFGGTATGYDGARLGNAAVEPGTIPMVDPRTTFVRA